MIYIHQIGIHNSKENDDFDVKIALKQVTTKAFRRTDRFIQLALLGAHYALKDNEVNSNTGLYMVSGQGNMAVFNRLRDQKHINKQPPKPVDFINSLSNTAGFYIAQFLGLHSKNLNLSHHSFGVEMTLLLVQNDLELGKEEQVLVGGVDELLRPISFSKKFLGICDDNILGEGSNWMLVNTKKEHALASIDVIKGDFDLDQVHEYIQKKSDIASKVAFGLRCKDETAALILEKNTRERFSYEYSCGFYETVSFYILNKFINEGCGELILINNFKERFRLLKVNVLHT